MINKTYLLVWLHKSKENYNRNREIRCKITEKLRWNGKILNNYYIIIKIIAKYWQVNKKKLTLITTKRFEKWLISNKHKFINQKTFQRTGTATARKERLLNTLKSKHHIEIWGEKVNNNWFLDRNC